MNEIKGLEGMILEAAIKMSDGNPGALQCTLNLIKKDWYRYVLLCDSLGLYGVKLYMLWNDFCNRDTDKMATVLDAYAIGKLSAAQIQEHLAGVRGKPFEESELGVKE